MVHRCSRAVNQRAKRAQARVLPSPKNTVQSESIPTRQKPLAIADEEPAYLAPTDAWKGRVDTRHRASGGMNPPHKDEILLLFEGRRLLAAKLDENLCGSGRTELDQRWLTLARTPFWRKGRDSPFPFMRVYKKPTVRFFLPFDLDLDFGEQLFGGTPLPIDEQMVPARKVEAEVLFDKASSCRGLESSFPAGTHPIPVRSDPQAGFPKSVSFEAVLPPQREGFSKA